MLLVRTVVELQHRRSSVKIRHFVIERESKVQKTETKSGAAIFLILDTFLFCRTGGAARDKRKAWLVKHSIVYYDRAHLVREVGKRIKGDLSAKHHPEATHTSQRPNYVA